MDMQQAVIRFLRAESGATAIEYGLIAALVILVIITAVSFLGANLQNTLYSGIAAL
jgi:pilus assembly protein Flp/PilA